MTTEDAQTTLDGLIYRSIPLLMLVAVASIVVGFITQTPAAYLGAALFLVAWFATLRVSSKGGPLAFEMAKRSANWTVQQFEWGARDNGYGRSRMDISIALAEKHGYRQSGELALRQGWRPSIVATLVKDAARR
jgi:hypothetical protein